MVSQTVRILVFLAVQAASLGPLLFSLKNRYRYGTEREFFMVWIRIVVALSTGLLLPAPLCIQNLDRKMAIRASRAILCLVFQVLGFPVRFKVHVVIQMAQVAAHMCVVGVRLMKRHEIFADCGNVMLTTFFDLLVVDICLTSLSVLTLEYRSRRCFEATQLAKKQAAYTSDYRADWSFRVTENDDEAAGSSLVCGGRSPSISTGMSSTMSSSGEQSYGDRLSVYRHYSLRMWACPALRGWFMNHISACKYSALCSSRVVSIKFHSLHLADETTRSIQDLRSAILCFLLDSGDRRGKTVPLSASVCIVRGCVQAVATQRNILSPSERSSPERSGDQHQPRRQPTRQIEPNSAKDVGWMQTVQDSVVNAFIPFDNAVSSEAPAQDYNQLSGLVGEMPLEDLQFWEVNNLLKQAPEHWRVTDATVFSGGLTAHKAAGSGGFTDVSRYMQEEVMLELPEIHRLFMEDGIQPAWCIEVGKEITFILQCTPYAGHFLVCSQQGVEIPVDVRVERPNLWGCSLRCTVRPKQVGLLEFTLGQNSQSPPSPRSSADEGPGMMNVGERGFGGHQAESAVVSNTITVVVVLNPAMSEEINKWTQIQSMTDSGDEATPTVAPFLIELGMALSSLNTSIYDKSFDLSPWLVLYDNVVLYTVKMGLSHTAHSLLVGFLQIGHPAPANILHFAVLTRSLQLIEMLVVKFNIPIDCVSDNGITPLHLAVCCGDPDILEKLALYSGLSLEQLSDLCLELCYEAKLTPVDYARQQGCNETLNLVCNYWRKDKKLL